MSAQADFFKAEKEEASMNQYWYSKKTIDVLVSEIEMHGSCVAFLSCPSLFFSLTNEAVRKASNVFEFDRRWEQDPGFVFYDYNHPDKVPVSLWESFDYVVVDPPFITREVWSKYGETVKLILKKGGKVLFTSVIENHAMLEEVCGTKDEVLPLMVPIFRPSIPNLTYQYHCFVNYPNSKLEVANDELPPEDPKVLAARSMCNDMRESQKEFAHQMVSRDRTNEQAIPKLPAQEGGVNDQAMKWTRIPDGLTEYANGASAPPEEQQTIDYGPKYDGLLKKRTEMEKFKKSVDSVMKLCDAILKVSPGAAKKNAGKTPEEIEKEKNQLIEEKSVLLAEMTAIKDFCASDGSKDKDDVCLMMAEAIECLGKAHELTVDQYKELSADCTRKYKSKVFNRQKELLQEMKAAKKEREAELKAASQN